MLDLLIEKIFKCKHRNRTPIKVKTTPINHNDTMTEIKFLCLDCGQEFEEVE